MLLVLLNGDDANDDADADAEVMMLTMVMMVTTMILESAHATQTLTPHDIQDAERTRGRKEVKDEERKHKNR